MEYSQSVKYLHIRKRIRSLRLMHTRFARRNEYLEIFIFGRTMFDSRASAKLASAGISILWLIQEAKDLKTGSAQTVLDALFIVLLKNGRY